MIAADIMPNAGLDVQIGAAELYRSAILFSHNPGGDNGMPAWLANLNANVQQIADDMQQVKADVQQVTAHVQQVRADVQQVRAYQYHLQILADLNTIGCQNIWCSTVDQWRRLSTKSIG